MTDLDSRTPSERLHDCARQWNVDVETILTTATSLIAFGTRRSMPVVLKVARGREEWNAGELVAALDGHGVIPRLQHQPGAILMPRLIPGHDLTSLCLSGRDEEATDIIGQLIKEMSLVEPSLSSALPRAVDLLPDFQRYRDRAVGVFDEEIVERAESMFRNLCASQRIERVLHGDLHHYNVLLDDALGWTVIDPQGIVAELEFELGASLRNPDAPALLRDPLVLERRLNAFRHHLDISTDRALRWAFSQAVLAVIWPTEPGVGADLSIPFGAMVDAALQVLG